MTRERKEIKPNFEGLYFTIVFGNLGIGGGEGEGRLQYKNDSREHGTMYV